MKRADRDPIEAYLRQLRASLRAGAAEAELIVAEAEDHLRETTAVGLATGLTEREAQEAAISAFGSVRAVVRAHETTPGNLVKGRTPAAVIEDLCLAAWKGGAIGLTAVGASGLVVLVMNATLGRAFTGQPPAGYDVPQGPVRLLARGLAGAHTCTQAAMLEASSDAVPCGSSPGSWASRYSRRTPSSAISCGGTGGGPP